MKKLLMFFLSLVLCMGVAAAQAQEQRPGLDWEISMMPKPSAEELKAARWSIILENNLGVYAYDADSLTYSKVENGVPDKNLVSVLTKTVFTDKETLKKLNEQYKHALKGKEKVQYCEILMTFNLADKTYGVTNMDIYGSKKTLLQRTSKELKLLPVPAGSFAEAMLEICQQAAAADTKDIADK